MEKRPYFIFGDLVAAMLSGVASGGLVWWALPGGWWMVPAMFIGMALGMVVALLVGFLLAPFFGLFELMAPAMLSGMAAGMVIPMRGADALSLIQVACTGVTVGIIGCVLAYLLQDRLHGQAA
ncbi:MAG: hypothetical protein HQ504_08425 [Rhodospirillaceae bacterium]|nr:hypothetical protein [Rhodospirillaceae bacterium]